MKKLNNKKIGAMALTCILSAGALSGCGGGGGEPDEAAQSAAAVAISVETQQIKPDTIEQYINVSSRVSADNVVSVVPKVSGTVKSVNFKLGDKVNAGDVLFVIDDTDIRLQVQQSEAALNSAQSSVSSAQAGVESAKVGVANAQQSYNNITGGSYESQLAQLRQAVDTARIQYNDSVTSYNNTKALFDAGAASQKELDDAASSMDRLKISLDTSEQNLQLTEQTIVEESKASAQLGIEQAQKSVETAQAGVASAQAGVRQAEASLASARNQLEYTNVRAEISGVISSVNISQGSLASAQSPAMTIVDMDEIKLSFNVSDDVINRLSVGSKGYITISAASDEPFEGEITNISPAADSQTGLYPVEIYIKNPGGNIKPGMFASLRLVVDNRSNTVSVPLNSVLQDGGSKYVYIVGSDNTVKRRDVETGIQNDVNIEIVSGVQAGEQVVVVGQDFLSEDALVNITASY